MACTMESTRRIMFDLGIGYARPSPVASWEDEESYEGAHYTLLVHDAPPTATLPNHLGVAHVRTWPSVYNGTASHRPDWFQPARDADVLICGTDPFGLALGCILARQGITFRGVEKASSPCLSGRADGIHPRALEVLNAWGLANEVAEEGPILNSTVLWRNGVKLFHDNSSSCDSRYKGIHIITQGQIEQTTVRKYTVHSDSRSHPIEAKLLHVHNGREEVVRAQYFIGGDGAQSMIRQQMGVPFDGTDYPHILGFNIIISAEHGGLSFYFQINGDKARNLQENRKARRNASAVGETRIDDRSITPAEVLEQLNKIIAPYSVEFASPMSGSSMWRVSERVAWHYSTPDLRVHLGGNAAVLGAFGLNPAIYDASNLGWKLGLCIRNKAEPSILLPTYDNERRLFANRVIRCSGACLQFICNSYLPLAALRDLGDELESHAGDLPLLDGTTEADKQEETSMSDQEARPIHSCSLRNGVRAPSPRVCFAIGKTGYLYDELTGVSRSHILIFASDLRGPIRNALADFSRRAFHEPSGFYSQFGGAGLFIIVLITKAHLREAIPDEDAHYWYGINHARGAVVVVRPDLAVGVSVFPTDVGTLETYFTSFLLPVKEGQGPEALGETNGETNRWGKGLADDRASKSRAHYYIY
ncbi:FAD binding domain-containing protein [Aspergillus falconensis]